MKKNYKKHDQVVMHTCGEAEHCPGEIWTCTTDSFLDKSKQEVVFLHGFGGRFLCKYLQIVVTPNRS